MKGEYANTTYFVTDPDSATRLEYASIDETLSGVAMFSDGLEHLVLDYSNQTVLSDFFEEMSRPLTSRERSRDFNDDLGAFLRSPGLDLRTDDDKTLILAMRIPQECETDL